MRGWPERVEIREVGPRDGLQNEAPVPVGERVRLIEALARTGLRRIEAGAFVHPAAVPQMAGTEEVFAALGRSSGVQRSRHYRIKFQSSRYSAVHFRQSS